MTLIAANSEVPASKEVLPVADWRLIADYDRPGDYQMALDEALLESVIAGADPVVRFYTWTPYTLSLGVNQPLREIDREAVHERGLGLVRRLTGGRAVLHQHELTYSVIARETDPRVSGGVIESYRKISAALVDGLQSLGVGVTLAEPSKAMFRAMTAARRSLDLQEEIEGPGSAGSHGAVCFDAASAYEVTAGGRKLVGSAQARRGGALLQHGSILLDIDWDAWVSVFTYASPAGKERARSKLPNRMTSLSSELARSISIEEVQGALTRSFERIMSIALHPAAPSADEQSAANILSTEKYDTEGWTAKT